MTVRKLPGSNKYRLYSAAGKNLGTFPTRAAALRHEREVQYFKHAEDSGDATTRGKQLYIPGVPHSTRLDLRPPPPVQSKWKKGDSRIPTAPSAAPPYSNVDKTSLEYFAASFIAGVENENADAWEEYEGDPRTSLIAAAVRKLGLQRIQRVLGSGSFGTAALDEEGHVVKLTSDETEAHAGAVIKGKDLPHVVWIAGAWFVGGVEVSPGWMRGETRVGVLSMEKVEPINRFSREAHELNTIVHKVKRNEDAYPEAIFAMNPGEARHHLLHVSEVLEGELRARGGFDGDLLHDIAAALHELREHGVYAVDVHSGNVGLDEESGVHKVYDIGTSSSPARPKPPVILGKGSKNKSAPRRQAREDYILAYEVPVPEL